MVSRAEIDEAYAAYHRAVNMTAAELRRWSKNACSRLASVDRSPIERNLRLLSTAKRAWGAREVTEAKRTISFVARMRGVAPGKPARAGCPSKRDIALKNWAFDPEKEPYRRNRPRIYDALGEAREMRETFADRPVERREHFRFGWPPVLQNVGDSLAVAYGSDKWEKRDRHGKRAVELYKHLAESRNRALILPGLLRDEDDPGREWPTIGPLVSLEGAPMPRHFAVLGYFEECHVKLHTAGTNARPRFGRGRDDGIVRLDIRHAMLGASKVRWNEVEPYRAERQKWLRANPDWQPGDDGGPPDYDEPFIFVYTGDEGVMMIVVGDRLGIAADGIVG